MFILKSIGVMTIIILFLVIVALAMTGMHYFIMFHWRRCKYCNSPLEYKGLWEDGCHYFYCPKCGKWEQIPNEKLLDNTSYDSIESRHL